MDADSQITEVEGKLHLLQASSRGAGLNSGNSSEEVSSDRGAPHVTTANRTRDSQVRVGVGVREHAACA